MAADAQALKQLHLLYQKKDHTLPQACMHYLQQYGEHAEPYNLLGALAREQRNINQALQLFMKTVQVDHAFIPGYLNLARTFTLVSMFDKAAVAFKQALAFAPHNEEILRGLIDALTSANRYEEAKVYLQTLKALKPGALYAFEEASMSPVIWHESQAIKVWRSQFAAKIAELPHIELKKEYTHIGYTKPQFPFDAVYQGEDNLPLKQAYAAHLHYTPPLYKLHNAIPRIGFHVGLNRDLVFLNVIGALLQQWDAEDLRPVVLCHAEDIALRAAITNPHVEFVTYTDDWSCIDSLREHAKLDMLYFWEIGSTKDNYLLPFFRLAPIQVTSWGSVESTGIPMVDYFISSKDQETAESKRFYSEKLVLFNHIPAYFSKPAIEAAMCFTRADFGLEETQNIYFCAQNIRKIHPDMDAVFAGILHADPNALLLLMAQHDTPDIANAFTSRLVRHLGKDIERVRFLRHMEKEEYLGLTYASDVVLDTLYYCGGQTSYDAIAVGTPIITLAAQTMRSRSTAAMYKVIGLIETIAHTTQGYIEKAVKMATDKEYQADFRRRALAANDMLYENKTSLDEHIQFFRSLFVNR